MDERLGCSIYNSEPKFFILVHLILENSPKCIHYWYIKIFNDPLSMEYLLIIKRRGSKICQFLVRSPIVGNF